MRSGINNRNENKNMTTDTHMTGFARSVSPGNNSDTGSLWVTIRWENRNGGMELSITAVEGPMKNGDCRGSAGQRLEALDRLTNLYLDWTPEMVTRLGVEWERWHLNRMRAGTAAQMAFLRTADIGLGGDRYAATLDALTTAGLNPDNGYVYGSAWLSEEVPTDVIEWLSGLPLGTTAVHPWGY